MGVGTAIGVGGIASAGIGAAGSIAAGSSQAGAANNAANLQSQEAANATAEQQREFNINQTNQAPFLQAGTGAINTLSGLVPQLNAASAAYPTFQAPTAEEARNTPGYQFTQQQGQQTLENSAAARGGLLSGNTGQALEQYGQGLADTTYNDVYNRSLQTYQNNFNAFNTGQANQFNRYAALAGVGQQSANQLGAAGQATAGNIANIDLTSGAQIGQQINNAAAANASGYVGAANAGSSAINNVSQLSLLKNSGLFNSGSGAGSASDMNNSSDWYLP